MGKWKKEREEREERAEDRGQRRDKKKNQMKKDIIFYRASILSRCRYS